MMGIKDLEGRLADATAPDPGWSTLLYEAAIFCSRVEVLNGDPRLALQAADLSGKLRTALSRWAAGRPCACGRPIDYSGCAPRETLICACGRGHVVPDNAGERL